MLVSETRNFVFVHVFKTGGTSVKRALRRYSMARWKEVANFFFKRLGIPQYGPRFYPDHWRVSDLIEAIGETVYQRYFSFAFVRNPWDLEVSHYKYILKASKHPSQELVRRLGGFSEYIRWRCDGNAQIQSDLLTWKDQLAVDFVGRFESLEQDFALICRQLGVRSRLPRLNRTRRDDYRSYYDDQTREMVEQAFREDLERFSYSFESTSAAA